MSGIKRACLGLQTAANVSAGENNELFQEMYLFSFPTPQLILRNETGTCFPLGMFEFTSPKSRGTRSTRLCLCSHARRIKLLFISLPTFLRERIERAYNNNSNKNHLKTKIDTGWYNRNSKSGPVKEGVTGPTARSNSVCDEAYAAVLSFLGARSKRETQEISSLSL